MRAEPGEGGGFSPDPDPDPDVAGGCLRGLGGWSRDAARCLKWLAAEWALIGEDEVRKEEGVGGVDPREEFGVFGYLSPLSPVVLPVSPLMARVGDRGGSPLWWRVDSGDGLFLCSPFFMGTPSSVGVRRRQEW